MTSVVYRIVTGNDLALEPADDDLGEARAQLRAARLVGDHQDQLRERILAFVDEHPDCLHRSCLGGHLTGSGFIVDPEKGKTLLIHHAKLDRWLQPGGHADGDGNLGAVAMKEAAEETGLVGLHLVTPAIDIDVHTIPARADEPVHLHLDVRFLVLVGHDRAPAPNHETLGARWMSLDDPACGPGTELHRGLARALGVAAGLES